MLTISVLQDTVEDPKSSISQPQSSLESAQTVENPNPETVVDTKVNRRISASSTVKKKKSFDQ